MALLLWGPVEATCKGIPSCPSCRYLHVLLYSSLQFVPVSLISWRPGSSWADPRKARGPLRMQSSSLPACLVHLYGLDDSASARGWKSLSPHSWRVISKTHPASGEQGFSAFLESTAAGRGSSMGLDGSPLAACSYLNPHEPDLPGFLKHCREVTVSIFGGLPEPRPSLKLPHPRTGDPKAHDWTVLLFSSVETRALGFPASADDCLL